MPLEPLNLDLPEHPPCSFCGAARDARIILFVNESKTTFVCDVCVEVLAARLHDVQMLASIPTAVRH